jgi:hypothetical protein
MDLRSYDSVVLNLLSIETIFTQQSSGARSNYARKNQELLFSLDSKIHLNKQMSTTAETVISALYKSWFVDFLPVKAKNEKTIMDSQALLNLFARYAC